jgi:hypothetical protein
MRRERADIERERMQAYREMPVTLCLLEEVVELASVLKQNRPSILEVVELATALKLHLCLLEEVVELASVLKLNQPSILEVVEFTSVRQYPPVSICEYETLR